MRTKKFALRIDEYQFRLLEEIAAINQRSINQMINIAIDEMLEKYQMIDEMEANAYGKLCSDRARRR